MRSILLAAAASLVVVAPATAHPLTAPTHHHAAWHRAGPVVKRYSALWHACADKADCTAGRNIRRYGVRTANGARVARRSDYSSSIARFERWLHPPIVAPAPVLTSPVAPNSAPVTVATTASYSGAMPACTWVPESGGSYTAKNPSGAGGKYQIMPSTWKANGGVEANAADAPPAEQEAVARRVMATQGAGAWVNC